MLRASRILFLQLLLISRISETWTQCLYEQFKEQTVQHKQRDVIRTPSVKSLAKCQYLCEEDGYKCMGGILKVIPVEGLECTLLYKLISEDDLRRDVYSLSFRKRGVLLYFNGLVYIYMYNHQLFYRFLGDFNAKIKVHVHNIGAHLYQC